MKKAIFRRSYTGLDVCRSAVTLVQMTKEKGSWKVRVAGRVPLPEGTLRPSYRDKNILDPEAFGRAVKEALGLAGRKVKRIGLSLPNDLVKLKLYRLNGDMETRAEIEKAIADREKAILPIAVQDAGLSCFPVGRSEDGKKGYLVSIFSREVVRSYEAHFLDANISPEIVQPSCVSHFNCHTSCLSQEGTSALLGIFENHYVLWVIDRGRIAFVRLKRRNPSSAYLLKDLEIAFGLFKRAEPQAKIDKIILADQAGSESDVLQKRIAHNFGIEASGPELNLISTSADLGRENLSGYSSAMGAAQSLCMKCCRGFEV